MLGGSEYGEALCVGPTRDQQVQSSTAEAAIEVETSRNVSDWDCAVECTLMDPLRQVRQQHLGY